MTNEFFYKQAVVVVPSLIYPSCLRTSANQDCLNCETYKKQGWCSSPRGLCVKAYPNHKKGCPNYGKREGCPLGQKMFNQVYDLLRPVYAIYAVFDFKGHVDQMRKKHPDWSQRQLECCLYWQGTARKELKERIETFKWLINDNRYVVTDCPEAMGVNVTETMKTVGIELEWPPVNKVYKIAFAGILNRSTAGGYDG